MAENNEEKKTIYKEWWFWIIIVVILVCLSNPSFFYFFNDSAQKEYQSSISDEENDNLKSKIVDLEDELDYTMSEKEQLEEKINDNDDDEYEAEKIDYDMLLDDEQFEALSYDEVYTLIKKIVSFEKSYEEKEIVKLDDNKEKETTKVLIHKCFAEDYSGNKWYVEIPDNEYYPYENVYLYGWLYKKTMNEKEYLAIDFDYFVANLESINRNIYKDNARKLLSRVTNSNNEIVFDNERFIEGSFITLQYTFNYGDLDILFENDGNIKGIEIEFNGKVENFDNKKICNIIQSLSPKNLEPSYYISEASKIKNTFDEFGDYAGIEKNGIICKIFDDYKLIILDEGESKNEILYFYFR